MFDVLYVAALAVALVSLVATFWVWLIVAVAVVAFLSFVWVTTPK